MQKKQYLLALLFFLFGMSTLQAQDDDDDFEEFDMSSVEAADDTKIKIFCNNKITNLSPTTLVGVSYDVIMPFDLQSSYVDSNGNDTLSYTSALGVNHGARLDFNVPILSKSSIIFNLTGSYWESRYTVDAADLETGHDFAAALTNNPLRTSTLGLLVFKPLNQKNFLIFQAEAAVNGNYNFDNISPEFSKMKYSASALFGWKFSDNSNFAFGATRTYRGGRLLYIPIVMWNKTWNPNWGVEMLLPARASLRRNFSTKSMLLAGYEFEGQSYFMQSPDNTGLFASNDFELRKSEIRPRLQFRQALSDFIWLDMQVGARVAYRFDLDTDADSTEPFISNDIGTPLYFRIGLAMVSP